MRIRHGGWLYFNLDAKRHPMSSRIQKTGVNGECQAYVLQERAVQTQQTLVSKIDWVLAMEHVDNSKKQDHFVLQTLVQ